MTKKTRKTGPRVRRKVDKVMKEFRSGKLKDSSGKKVTDPKQAVAIGYSEARRGRKS